MTKLYEELLGKHKVVLSKLVDSKKAYEDTTTKLMEKLRQYREINQQVSFLRFLMFLQSLLGSP